jgi:hypothetical protein
MGDDVGMCSVDHGPRMMAAYRSPMASMMAAAPTVRTMMTPLYHTITMFYDILLSIIYLLDQY